MEKRLLAAPCHEPRRSSDNKEVILHCGGQRIELRLGDGFSIVICSICDRPCPVAVPS